MNITLLTCLTVLSVLLVASTMSFALTVEKGDTLLIGPFNGMTGQPVGALNDYIMADTSETGEQLHSVYELYRDSTYIVTATLRPDYNFKLVAKAPTVEHKPPVIRGGQKEDGSNVDPLIELYSDHTFKNLWFSGVDITGSGPISWQIIVRACTNARMVYEGCIFEAPYTWWCLFNTSGSHNVHIMENCMFKNIGHPYGNIWNGAVRGGGSAADSVILRNNTYFNIGCAATNCPEDVGVLYTEIDHCTFVNSVVHQWILNKPVIAKVTNNVLVNCHVASGGPQEINAHPDKEIHGIVHLFQFDPFLLDSTWGNVYDPNGDGTLEEGERVYELKNNVWYYTDPIEQYWADNDTIFAQRWYCNATREFFVNNDEDKEWSIGDDTTYTIKAHPLFVEENTWNEDPGFVNIGNSDVLLAGCMVNKRSIEAGDTTVVEESYHYDPDGSYIAFGWPLEESLAYTNTKFWNAGTDGKPLGDNNWFDHTNFAVAVDDDQDKTVVSRFNLEKNYPNPFNPTTTIDYQINKPGQVKLSVYNILGEKVKILVNENKIAGSYSVTWEGTNDMGAKVATGVYIYKLEMGDQVQSQKMLMIK